MNHSQSQKEDPILGVLGGLGPEATVSFMSKVIDYTPAEKDQDHIEMVVYNDPKVPDRNYPERRTGEGPLPRLIRNASRLEKADADFIVIASNTTHRYYDEIAETVSVPMPHMISLVHEQIESLDVQVVGVLTTDTAMEIGLFDDPFSGSSIEVIYPEDMGQVMDSIYAFKRGNKRESKELMDSAVDNLSNKNVDVIILGCTEFSALPWDRAIRSIDSASVLARHCVEQIYSK